MPVSLLIELYCALLINQNNLLSSVLAITAYPLTMKCQIYTFIIGHIALLIDNKSLIKYKHLY